MSPASCPGPPHRRRVRDWSGTRVSLLPSWRSSGWPSSSGPGTRPGCQGRTRRSSVPRRRQRPDRHDPHEPGCDATRRTRPASWPGRPMRRPQRRPANPPSLPPRLASPTRPPPRPGTPESADTEPDAPTPTPTPCAHPDPDPCAHPDPDPDARHPCAHGSRAARSGFVRHRDARSCYTPAAVSGRP